MTTNTSAHQTITPSEQAGTMRAVVQRRYGAPSDVLKLEDVRRPSAGDGDVLIRVHATSVNTPDRSQ
jgi:NADPH:quinone reductase-like Zn-dependent oxidoreductase